MTSLQCYECRTDHSWEKCDSISTKITCPASKPKCIKIDAQNKVTGKHTYIKGCWDGDCTQPSFCRPGGMQVCTLECCHGNDFCNRGGISLFPIVPNKFRTQPPLKTTASAHAASPKTTASKTSCLLISGWCLYGLRLNR